MVSQVIRLPLVVAALSGCASGYCIPEKPRVASQTRGIPQTVWEGSSALIGREPRRYCQVLFEPAFSTHHAVWLTQQSASAEGKVSVSVRTSETAVELYETSLDERTSALLGRLCRAFLTSEPPACARIGLDGVWYHAAHHLSDSGYAMRSLWSPKRDSLDGKFVRLAEALRDYATARPALRMEYWWNIQRAALELECALQPKIAGCI